MRSYLNVILFFAFGLCVSTAQATVYHRDGYSSIRLSKSISYDDVSNIVNKITDAFGKDFETFTDPKNTPKLSKFGDEAVAYILRDLGKARDEKPARRKVQIVIFNQDIPQTLIDLALEEFGGAPEDFTAFAKGFRFSAREKGVSYTLYGAGTTENLFSELSQKLQKAGYSVDGTNYSESGHLAFKNNVVEGTINLDQTSPEPPNANVLVKVKTDKCQSKYGEISVPTPHTIPECQ